MIENKLKPYILGTIPRPAQNSTAWDEKEAEAQCVSNEGIRTGTT